MKINAIDHIVMTVGSVDKTCAFYSQILGMDITTFGNGRKALSFGVQKFNLHQAGEERAPNAHVPMPGSIDLCLITDTPIGEVAQHLRSVDVEIIKGPIKRAGAIGPIISLYLRDPDQNLIEISNYL